MFDSQTLSLCTTISSDFAGEMFYKSLQVGEGLRSKDRDTRRQQGFVGPAHTPKHPDARVSGSTVRTISCSSITCWFLKNRILIYPIRVGFQKLMFLFGNQYSFCPLCSLGKQFGVSFTERMGSSRDSRIGGNCLIHFMQQQETEGTSPALRVAQPTPWNTTFAPESVSR